MLSDIIFKYTKGHCYIWSSMRHWYLDVRLLHNEMRQTKHFFCWTMLLTELVSGMVVPRCGAVNAKLALPTLGVKRAGSHRGHSVGQTDQLWVDKYFPITTRKMMCVAPIFTSVNNVRCQVTRQLRAIDTNVTAIYLNCNVKRLITEIFLISFSCFSYF